MTQMTPLIRKHLRNMFSEMVEPWLGQPVTVELAMRIADVVHALTTDLKHEVDRLGFADQDDQFDLFDDDMFDDVLHDVQADSNAGADSDTESHTNLSRELQRLLDQPIFPSGPPRAA